MHLVSYERREVSRAAAANANARAGEHSASMGDAALDYEALEELPHGSTRLGALLPHGTRAGDVVDLNRALAIKLALEDVGAPEAAADSLLPSNACEFLAHLPSSFPAALDALAFVLDCLDRYDAPDILRTGVVEPLRRVRLLPPVPRPGKILSVDRNYPGPGAPPTGGQHPPAPEFFLEASTSLVGPGDDILIPKRAGRAEARGSLAVVIGQLARGVARDEALEFVAGYCIANDVAPADRDGADRLQIGHSQDSFTPLGPSLVTSDEVPNPQDLAIRTEVSQRSTQSAGTKQMFFGVAELVAAASQVMTLEAGDVILTGSPAIAGDGTDRRQRGLRDGDVVEIEIDRLGRLRNYVRAAPDEGT
jgi:2-keto-4-pentenoate hydratase/2-oxohepta-3-ene-1,7-dioic acid hydratase in catechol pathway